MKENNMYIITGGAGFIGSALVWELNNRGIEDIIIADHLGTGEKWKNLVPLKYTDYYEKEDMRELINKNSGILADASVIIHLGACSSTMETDASYLVDNNFNYSKELADFAVKNSIRMIYASSAATYGDGSLGYKDDESEIHKLRPLNMYGYSKQMFDLWVRKKNLLPKLTGLKFTNVYGPNEWHKDDMRSLVCKAYEQIKETGKLKLFKSHHPDYKDGEQMRDFLYIKDAVKMITHVIDTEISGIYNIGSGKAETWNKLATAIFEGMNLEPNIEYVDMPEHLRNKYQYYTKADMTKFTATGYSSTAMPLRDAVIDYVENHLIPSAHLEPNSQ
jgi:ADP-L-glycero-D-manno-heptose 6-epimerase